MRACPTLVLMLSLFSASARFSIGIDGPDARRSAGDKCSAPRGRITQCNFCFKVRHVLLRLAKRGYDLILVARNEARLKELSARLTSETGRSVKVLRADLNDKADLAKVEATLRNDASITMLVNNAGTASVAPLLKADVEKMEEIIALNVTALTRLTYAAAPAFVERRTGAIINIGSIVGISPETLNGGTARRRRLSLR